MVWIFLNIQTAQVSRFALLADKKNVRRDRAMQSNILYNQLLTLKKIETFAVPKNSNEGFIFAI